MSADDGYRALSNQQRLIESLTYGCEGRIGRILVAAQNRGSGGNRDSYPEIHIMRKTNPSYYHRIASFELNELTGIRSPNLLEFVANGSYANTYARSGDVVRIYQPSSSDSVYGVYHEPGVGPNNYFINGYPSNTRTVFPLRSISSQDNSQPLFIVELGKALTVSHYVYECYILCSLHSGQMFLTEQSIQWKCKFL